MIYNGSLNTTLMTIDPVQSKWLQSKIFYALKYYTNIKMILKHTFSKPN